MSSDAHSLALRVLHREMGWREDLKQLEEMATTTRLGDWWREAGIAERHRFVEDFLELYLHDPPFTSAIDTLLGRAK